MSDLKIYEQSSSQTLKFKRPVPHQKRSNSINEQESSEFKYINSPKTKKDLLPKHKSFVQ